MSIDFFERLTFFGLSCSSSSSVERLLLSISSALMRQRVSVSSLPSPCSFLSARMTSSAPRVAAPPTSGSLGVGEGASNVPEE